MVGSNLAISSDLEYTLYSTAADLRLHCLPTSENISTEPQLWKPFKLDIYRSLGETACVADKLSNNHYLFSFYCL